MNHMYLIRKGDLPCSFIIMSLWADEDAFHFLWPGKRFVNGSEQQRKPRFWWFLQYTLCLGIDYWWTRELVVCQSNFQLLAPECRIAYILCCSYAYQETKMYYRYCYHLLWLVLQLSTLSSLLLNIIIVIRVSIIIIIILWRLVNVRDGGYLLTQASRVHCY